MIEFQKVFVRNFFSIKEATIDFKKGVYLVYGKNYDIISEVDTSNGSGKTSLFNAIYQGLFNKNLKDPKGLIGTVSNLYTQQPYYIEVYFKIKDDEYKIVNNRNKAKIFIYKNGENISLKTISQNLNLIQEILGFDFNIFSSLTFLNTSVLENIIDMTSENNLLYQFFDINSLSKLEKHIRRQVKTFREKQIMLSGKEQEYVNNLTLLKNMPEIDEKGLEATLVKLQKALEDLEKSQLVKDVNSYNNKLEKLRKEYKQIENLFYSKKSELSSLKKLERELSQGICPVCGQATNTINNKFKQQIANLQVELEDIIKQKQDIKQQGEEVKKIYTELYNKYRDEQKRLETEISTIEQERLKSAQNLAYYKNLQDTKEQINNNLQKVKQELNTIQEYLNLYAKILEALSKGYVIEVYLQAYINLLRLSLKEYLKQTHFGFNIRVSIKKGKLIYTFVDGKVEKTFGQLSSGEKIRVSLVLLLANLSALQTLTGVEVNFVVFDELLGSLDEEGLDFVKKAINNFRKDKSVFIITHHDEINTNYADYLLFVEKRNNVATTKYENLKE